MNATTVIQSLKHTAAGYLEAAWQTSDRGKRKNIEAGYIAILEAIISATGNEWERLPALHDEITYTVREWLPDNRNQHRPLMHYRITNGGRVEKNR